MIMNQWERKRRLATCWKSPYLFVPSSTNVEKADWRAMVTRKFPIWDQNTVFHFCSATIHDVSTGCPKTGLKRTSWFSLAVQPALALSQGFQPNDENDLVVDEDAKIFEQIQPSLNLRWGITPVSD